MLHCVGKLVGCSHVEACHTNIDSCQGASPDIVAPGVDTRPGGYTGLPSGAVTVARNNIAVVDFDSDVDAADVQLESFGS